MLRSPYFEKNARDDMVHAKELGGSEEESGPPREDSESVEDEGESEGRQDKDGEEGVAR